MVNPSAPAPSDSLCFTRLHRLLDASEFQAVFDAPDWRVSDRYFLVLARRNTGHLPRLGLVIGKKKARKAVDRAAIKRRAREQFRLRQQRLAGLDLIILLRGSCPNQGGRSLTPELERLLDKLLAKRGQD